MTSLDTIQDCSIRIREFIQRWPEASSSRAEDEFNRLALDLFALQFTHVPVYRGLCQRRETTPENLRHWSDIPAIPTSAFKDFEVSSLPAKERTTVFQSSGTTAGNRSRHYHDAGSLAVYEASLLPWFERNVLADWGALVEAGVVGPLDKPGMILLTPAPALAPGSSLVHMLETVRGELGSSDSFFAGRIDEGGAWTLDLERVLFGLRKSMGANRPVALLGTAFSFVHLLDQLAARNIRHRLAAGSRVMETGGYKGRSREMPKAELHRRISEHLGIPPSHVICEYGMSELSSQAYDGEARDERSDVPGMPRVFRFPPWARARVISPETGGEVAEGETGLLRIFDLANVRSVMAVQTEDLGIRRADGFELLGRATVAEARGCSLMSA